MLIKMLLFTMTPCPELMNPSLGLSSTTYNASASRVLPLVGATSPKKAFILLFGADVKCHVNVN